MRPAVGRCVACFTRRRSCNEFTPKAALCLTQWPTCAIFFADFEFAKTSEYKLDKRVGKECLTVYERVTTSGAQDILTQARVFLGPKNCLDHVSKLIAISQKVSASCQPSGPAGERMAFVLGFVYIRLRCGRLHEHVGVRSLKATELPTAILAHKVLQHTLATY